MSANEKKLREERARLLEEVRAYEETLTSKRQRLHDVRKELGRIVKERGYTPSDLRYAAYARCTCGAGLAYPLETEVYSGEWSCSALLLGEAADGAEHTEPRPFVFYEIKSEGQPSARGATTREPKAEATS